MAESGRHYTQEDLTLAEDLARRAAVALENARLYSQAHERQEWLSVTLGSIGDAVIATDPKGEIVFMNGVAERLTGWNRAEIKQRQLREVFTIVNELSREKVESPVDKALREGRLVELANHVVLIARDGSEIPIEDSAAPIRDRNGRVLGVVMVFHDVTSARAADRERTRLLDEVTEQRELMANILQNVPGIVWELRGDPVSSTQRLEFVSAFAEELLGYDATVWKEHGDFL
jgi:PAS domain S-box-containing protein